MPMLTTLRTMLLNGRLSTKCRWIIAIPLATLLATSSAIYVVQRLQRQAVATVLRSKDAGDQLYHLITVVGDIESNQRAYLLTGDETWRDAFQAERPEIDAVLAPLDALIRDPSQRRRLARLPGLIGQRLTALEAVAEDARARGVFPADVPAARLAEGRRLMAAVRAETTVMLQDQRVLIAARTSEAQRTETVLLAVAGAGAVAGVVGGIVALVLLTLGVSSRVGVLMDGVDKLARGEPLPPPPPGEDEIGVLGRQLHQTAALLAERERALREANATFDRFFTLSPDLCCVADFEGRFRRVNPAWQSSLGWSEQELLAQPFLNFVHPDDREATVRETETLGHGLTTVNFENRYRCPDGTYRWLQWMAAPLPEEARIYAVARDVTGAKQDEARMLVLTQELARRNAQLAALNHELEAFSYSVSHDLRAPLRSIDGFSQVLLEDYADRLDAEGKDALQRVRRAATSMAELIDALLALSRLSRVELQTEPVDASALALTIADGLRQAAPERQVDFVIAPNLTVDADPTLLQALLENLLNNAWKYSGPRDVARIEFGSVDRDGETVYFVRDNGVGFDMAYVDKLFGAFQRLHHQSEFVGTGVGLATVQRIAHRHGGRVWAEGAVDQGATFYVALPHGPAQAASPALESAVQHRTP